MNKTDDVMGVCGIVCSATHDVPNVITRGSENMKERDVKANVEVEEEIEKALQGKENVIRDFNPNDVVPEDAGGVVVDVERGSTMDWPTITDFFYDLHRFSSRVAAFEHFKRVFSNRTSEELNKELTTIFDHCILHSKDTCVKLYRSQCNPDKQDSIDVSDRLAFDGVIERLGEEYTKNIVHSHAVMWTELATMKSIATRETGLDDIPPPPNVMRTLDGDLLLLTALRILMGMYKAAVGMALQSMVLKAVVRR